MQGGVIRGTLEPQSLSTYSTGAVALEVCRAGKSRSLYLGVTPGEANYKRKVLLCDEIAVQGK